MPMEINAKAGDRCFVCGKIIREAVIVKTCCNNKPRSFCSPACYQKWKAEWMRRQEQIGRERRVLL